MYVALRSINFPPTDSICKVITTLPAVPTPQPPDPPAALVPSVVGIPRGPGFLDVPARNWDVAWVSASPPSKAGFSFQNLAHFQESIREAALERSSLLEIRGSNVAVMARVLDERLGDRVDRMDFSSILARRTDSVKCISLFLLPRFD